MLERNPEAIEYVLHEAREHDVKFIRLWFTDILGSLKGFAITVEELEGALTRGMGFDGSAIAGFARTDESATEIVSSRFNGCSSNAVPAARRL